MPALLEQLREQLELLAAQLDRARRATVTSRACVSSLDVADVEPLLAGGACVRRSTALTRAASSRGENGFVT